MKATIHTFLISCTLMLCSFSANAQQIALTLAAQGTQPYTAGNSFTVNANYNYTGITGNIEISMSYDHTVLNFCGSTAFPVLPTSSSSGSITTLKYVFPAVLGNTQSTVIMMCFSFICPSTCFGPLSTTVNGTISAPGNSVSDTPPPLQITGQVNNNWNGQHAFFSYVQSSAEITFRVMVYGSSCHNLGNPVFTINPSLGTLVHATNSSISGNSFTPANSFFSMNQAYIFYYTLQLPCNLDSGTVVTSGIVLKGSNCGINPVTIFTPPPVSYVIPAITPPSPSAVLTTTSYNGYYSIHVANNGNTPLNLSLQSILPDINTTTVQHGSSQSGLNATLSFENCANAVSTHPFNQGLTVQAPTHAKKATIVINNLLPGFYSTFYVYYDLSNSCSGVPVGTSFPLYTTMSYVCDTANQAQVCMACGSGGSGSDTTIYNKAPKITCHPPANLNPNCLSPGDTAELCIQIRNSGSAPLLGGVLNANLQSFLSFVPGSESFSGFSVNPVYQSGSSVKWNLPELPDSAAYYKVCFKAIVNSNAPYGNYVLPFSVSGTSYEENFNCGHQLKICALPQVEVEKKVKGDVDLVYGTNGNGTPGSYATYEVTVKNTGNTGIGNIILIDRLPFQGDLSIMSCNPRNSQFALMPDGAVSIIGATVKYSNVSNAGTGWPTANTLCNTPATPFSSVFAPNNLEIHLSNSIPPGGTHVFTFTVKVPDNAVVGDKACNTIGLICDFFNNLNQGSQLNPVESNNICLEVKPAPVIPQNCCGDLIKEIETETKFSKGVLKVNTTLTAGPIKLQKVSVSLIDFRVMQTNGCESCEKQPVNMGNFVQAGGPLTWNFPIAGAGFGRLLEWSDPSGKDWSNGIPLDFDIPLPPHSAISCCCDTILYCLKYSFTDTNCVTCDTVICYKDIHGKECSPEVEDPDCCDLEWEAPDHPTYCIGDQVKFRFKGCVESGVVNIQLIDASNASSVHTISSQYGSASGSYIWTIPQNFPCDPDRKWQLHIEEANRKCHAYGEKISITCCNEPVSCKCPENKWEKNAKLTYTDGHGNEDKVKLACFSENPSEVLAGTLMTYYKDPYDCGTPDCAAGYTWKIIDLSNNTLVNSGSSAGLPISWTAPSEGKYQFFIYANCDSGKTNCDSCSFHFYTLPKKEKCECGEWAGKKGFMIHGSDGAGHKIKTHLDCGKTYSSLYEGASPDLIAGQYTCKGKGDCKVAYVWRITSPKGHITNHSSQTISGFVFGEIGDYTVELSLVCNGRVCDTCISYINVKHKPK